MKKSLFDTPEEKQRLEIVRALRKRDLFERQHVAAILREAQSWEGEYWPVTAASAACWRLTGEEAKRVLQAIILELEKRHGEEESRGHQTPATPLTPKPGAGANPGD